MAQIATETVVVASEAVTLDLIVWQRFRRPMPGLLERILGLDENRHLEFCPVVLPLGTRVTVPIDTPRGDENVDLVSLWS